MGVSISYCVCPFISRARWGTLPRGSSRQSSEPRSHSRGPLLEAPAPTFGGACPRFATAFSRQNHQQRIKAKPTSFLVIWRTHGSLCPLHSRPSAPPPPSPSPLPAHAGVLAASPLPSLARVVVIVMVVVIVAAAGFEAASETAAAVEKAGFWSAQMKDEQRWAPCLAQL